jgi:hypothetical protein
MSRLKDTELYIILRVVLYGCETWYFTLKEECRLRIFENGVLRRILGFKKVQVTGVWRRPHSKNFMLCTPQQI